MPSPVLEDYDVGQVLGAGTVGTIYLATEKLTGEQVAIKKLHPGVSQDELIRARFRRETTILQRLRHPNIVACYGGGEAADGVLYYVMELVDGGTIKDMLESTGSMAWPIVVDVTRQICSALQAAHNHGVIHRDLKPGNLFLTRDATVKLGDFGIARDNEDASLTTTGLTVGTHAYMSPEQITGDDAISGKTDLYALGCCMMEMLAGRKPFLGDNFAQLFEQHLRIAPPRVRDMVGDCPPELDKIVDQLLAKSPQDRPFNARTVQGVMLQIGEKYGLRDENPPEGDGTDVGASAITQRGRAQMQRQIESRFGGGPRQEISRSKILMLVAVMAVIVGVALAMQ